MLEWFLGRSIIGICIKVISQASKVDTLREELIIKIIYI